MTWQEARKQIEKWVDKGTDVNTTRSSYRVISSRDDKLGFVVPIGQANFVSIPWKMLRICYEPIKNGTGYDGIFFRDRFPKQADVHSCYVHTVGQIFVKARLAIQVGRKYVCSR